MTEEVGEATRDLGDFDHQAKTTEGFLNNKKLNPKRLTLKQKIGRVTATAVLAGAGILAYKGGLLNTAEFESKGDQHNQDQGIDDVRKELQEQSR